MTGIDPDVVMQQLQVNPEYPPVKQKRRKFAPERNLVINEEVQKLLDNGSVVEVQYPDWLANVVVVKKKNGKWRVCIDFTDLNKACPKDPFPLPHIDMMVDATAGHELLSFMDAFSGYNQILMHPRDQEKTAFITDRGIYCYKVMPFGLKNAGATYQRLVNKMFSKYLGDTMEVYIDDMLVKSLAADQHLEHLQQAFDLLIKYNMKLNPAKCSFGVASGKFLGYMVTKRGIEANPDQIRSILNIPSPTCVKDIQRLNGRVAALSRFISRSSDKCCHFFSTLRKSVNYKWTPECEDALNQLKAYLTSPPLLSKPSTGEQLYMYLAVSGVAVSAVLVREENKKQLPVYYVSKSLLDAETRYSLLEKLALALVVAARKLRPYFQCHSVAVVTNFPLRSILHRPELSGRIIKWAVELSEYDITYQPRTAIKSQVLADFVVDFAPSTQLEADKELLCMVDQAPKVWTLYVDGSSNVRGSGLGIVLISPEGSVIQRAVRCGFHATNNEAEYEALIIGLKLAKELGVTSLKVYSDSQLIVNQFIGSYQAKDPKMTCYLELVKELQLAFVEFSVTQIPRAENSYADALAHLGSSIQSNQEQTIPLVHLKWLSISNQKEVEKQNDCEILPVSSDQTWMTPFVQYLVDGVLPAEKNESRRLVAKAARYAVHDEQLYRRSYSGPLLRCVNSEQAQYVLAELHEGECGNHSGGRSLTHRALTTGYYRPTMRSDAIDYVRRCDKCQRFAQIPRMPPEKLTPIVAPWPFMKWGMDIVGPLPKASGQRQYFLAMTDYFTKWIEAESYSLIKDLDVKKFVWKNIICRFGVPKEIVTDNGPQFASHKFQEFCANWGIKVDFTTPRHPQCNGQAEASNKTLIRTLEKRLEKAKGAWADELPGVLWSYRTTSRTPTGETPFSLAFGSEAVIPVEAGLPSATFQWANEQRNWQELNDQLDTIDELRDQALTRTAAYHDKVSKYFNQNVRTRAFREGDYVLRRVFENTRELNAGKLGPNWEGPYLIDRVLGNGAYRLHRENGEAILHPWNAVHLKLYHF
ncbi:uncharacterized protein LOC119989207 [Tripterygium wilfordii]|uniref:uncharacterized protein LOC119989207 n=1 Tax=Tripterygium wilfordii TaxID=458696 RepID=UPI0018F827EC|nr:uncharacterized protein LOC119989207 [Tripterygium wilfordii]